MKKTVLMFALSTIVVASSALAQVNVNVNVGLPVPRIVVPAPPSIHFDVAPLFIAPSRLGFYVGVDTPYDILFSSDSYYLYYSNSWHRSNHHNGPWVEVPYRELPPGIRNHRIEQIRSYRDREYRTYRHDRDNYRGRNFRPDHERKDDFKEERRRQKNEWKDDRRHDKEERRHDREERKEEKRDRKQHGHDRD